MGLTLLITNFKLLQAIRKAFLSHPKQIVIISDGAVDISPELLLQELIAANVKQVPLHFVTPTQEYTQPKFDLIGYKSVKSQIDKVIKIQKVPEIKVVFLRQSKQRILLPNVFLENCQNVLWDILCASISHSY